jgi:hypothetical protein
VRDRRLSCGEARALLDERLDGALAPAEEEVLAAHLEGCAPCRAAAAALGRVHSILGEPGPADPGEAFTARVVAALDRAPGGAGAADRPALRLLRGVAVAAGTAAFAGLAWLLLPVDAAAAALDGVLPAVPAPALPPIPESASVLAAGFVDFFSPWAAAAAAAAALAAAALPVASARRRRGGRA